MDFAGGGNSRVAPASEVTLSAAAPLVFAALTLIFFSVFFLFAIMCSGAIELADESMLESAHFLNITSVHLMITSTVSPFLRLMSSALRRAIRLSIVFLPTTTTWAMASLQDDLC